MENSSKEEPEQQEHEVKEVDEGVEDVAAVMEGMAVVDEDDDEVFEWDLEDASGEEDQLDAIGISVVLDPAVAADLSRQGRLADDWWAARMGIQPTR